MSNPAPTELKNMWSLGIQTMDLICGCGRHKEAGIHWFEMASRIQGRR